MCDERVGKRAAQVVGGQPFENLVTDAIAGRQCEIESDRIRDAGAVNIGWSLARGLRELRDLMSGAMNEDDADAQIPQERDVEQEIAKVVVLDNGAVKRDHEDLVAILRDIPPDPAQIDDALQPRVLLRRRNRSFVRQLVAAHSHGFSYRAATSFLVRIAYLPMQRREQPMAPAPPQKPRPTRVRS